MLPSDRWTDKLREREKEREREGDRDRERERGGSDGRNFQFSKFVLILRENRNICIEL